MDDAKEKLRRAIINRGLLAPVVEYDDGTQGFGVPGLLMAPVEAWQRLQAGASDEIARMQAGQPFSRQSIGDAFDVAGATALASLPAPKPAGALTMGGNAKPGIKAFHGSPHDFDKFSMDKIGTGEGAQAYGHGLYFAENEGVAQNYKAIGNADLQRAVHYDKAVLRDRLADPDANPAEIKQLEGRIARTEALIAKNPGSMYEVRINANPEDFLDWDKPLSQQSEHIRKTMHQLANGEILPDWNGMEAYRSVGSQMMENLDLESPELMSSLRDAGIPGIRYLDQGSRGAGEGSRNFVVFDDRLIDIVRKYGIAAAASMYGVSDLEIMDAMHEGGF